MPDETERLKKRLTAKNKTTTTPWDKGLSTGAALLNLALTGRPNVGFLPGHYYHVVGDSQSGKTFLSLTCLAEATLNPAYKDYRFMFDNPENGALMDVEKFFGPKLANLLEPPRMVKDRPTHSDTIEDFYFHVDDAVRAGKPFIYVLDSMDALTSEPEMEKFLEQKAASRKGRELTGSYGDGKAKKNSSGLRIIRNGLEDTGSILIVIDQTRDNIGFGSQFSPKTYSGGRALKFYATAQMWSSVKKTLSSRVLGRQRQTGIVAQIEVKKNRTTGQVHKVDIPIYWRGGIDDTGSMVDWLVEEGVWKKTDKGIDAKELGIKGTSEGVIAQIEEKGLEQDLKMIVAEAWERIVEACAVVRKKRY